MGYDVADRVIRGLWELHDPALFTTDWLDAEIRGHPEFGLPGGVPSGTIGNCSRPNLLDASRLPLVKSHWVMASPEGTSGGMLIGGGGSKRSIDAGECGEDEIFGSSGGGEITIEVPVGDVLSGEEHRAKK